MRRCITAVLPGFVLIAALSLGADAVLRSVASGTFDGAGRAAGPAILLLTLAYAGVFTVGSCYLTARLAPARPMWHALILGALGVACIVAGAVATWGTAPAWYHAIALVLVMPYAWLGGRLREREVGRAGGVLSR